jgi:hypothetical protein
MPGAWTRKYRIAQFFESVPMQWKSRPSFA